MSYTKAKQRYEETAPSTGIDRSLMCAAPGCPNRWSVDSGDKGINRKCSPHAWRDARKWTESDITAQQQDADNLRRYGSAQEPAF